LTSIFFTLLFILKLSWKLSRNLPYHLNHLDWIYQTVNSHFLMENQIAN